MMAAKEIVGEQYHIHGVGSGSGGGRFSTGYQGYPLSPSVSYATNGRQMKEV